MNTRRSHALGNFTQFFDALNAGVAIFDKNQKLLYINPAMKTVTGGRQGTGLSLSDLVQRHRLRTESGETILPENFPIVDAFRGIDTHDKLFEYVSDNGEHVWLSVSCLRILDENDELEYVYTAIANVTVAKSQREKLEFMMSAQKTLSLTIDFNERIRQKARLTVPSLADWCAIDMVNAENKIERAVVIHRDAKMIEYVREFEKKFPPDPSSPTSPPNVIRSGRAQYIPVITEEMIQMGASSNQHADALRKLQLSSLMVIPIFAKGKALGCMTLAYAESGRIYTDADFEFFKKFCDHLGVLLDNARLYNEITRRDAAKDIFLASLSHELRNPLSPIKTSLELMRLRGIPDDLTDEVDTIEHQFDHVTRLLSDLLDVTRYTHAKITLSKSHVDTKLIIERVVKACSTLARAALITVEYSAPASPLWLDADSTRIEQALMNLVSNAIKFTRAQGTIQINLSEAAGYARISVKDTGAGIDPKDLPNIFEMYYQGEGGKTRTSSGLGLGLYLVQKIAELHDGTVEAHSEGLGLGSEFSIHLPLSKKLGRNNNEQSKPSLYDPRGLNILIVDDNVAAADSLARLLSALGAKTETLYAGNDVLTRPGLEAFDSVILDVGMAGMNGYEVVKSLRLRGFSKPVVALTGFGLHEDREKALDAGFSAHITKPVSAAELWTVLKGLM